MHLCMKYMKLLCCMFNKHMYIHKHFWNGSFIAFSFYKPENLTVCIRAIGLRKQKPGLNSRGVWMAEKCHVARLEVTATFRIKEGCRNAKVQRDRLLAGTMTATSWLGQLRARLQSWGERHRDGREEARKHRGEIQNNQSRGDESVCVHAFDSVILMSLFRGAAGASFPYPAGVQQTVSLSYLYTGSIADTVVKLYVIVCMYMCVKMCVRSVSSKHTAV